MGSLVVLMMEEEQPEGLSARKLVVETEKHNVLTAYSADSGMKMLKRFPNVDVVLVHHTLLEKRPQLLEQVKGVTGDVPIIVATPLRVPVYREADYVIDSHNPGELIKVLKEKIGMR